MKLTYKDLKGIKYNSKMDVFKKKDSIYIYKDACKNCGEPFLAEKHRKNGKFKITDFCCGSCALMGHKISSETKAKIRAKKLGKKASLETRRKMSKAQTGRKQTPEAKRKIGEAHAGPKNHWFGKHLSDEVKAKISKSSTGRNLTSIHRQRISNAHKRGAYIVENSKAWKGGVKKLDIPLYDTYGPRLAIFEEVRIHMIRIGCVVYKSLQVRCNESGCRKWFRPKCVHITNRLQIFKNGGNGGQCNFYCSEICKAACSTFKQQKYRVGERPGQKTRKLPYAADEYKLYRQVVLERENYKCEYCDAIATCVHHEHPKKEQPMLALDPDYGHAVCKKCHMEYGHKEGTECSTWAIARKTC